MKLQVFTEKELTFKVADTATISISKAGYIVLNSASAFLLGVKKDTKVVLAQDSKEKCDWYIAVNDKEGVLLKEVGKNKLGWQGKSIANKLIASCDVPEHATSVLYRISDEPVELDGVNYYPIITVKPMRIGHAKS